MSLVKQEAASQGLDFEPAFRALPLGAAKKVSAFAVCAVNTTRTVNIELTETSRCINWLNFMPSKIVPFLSFPLSAAEWH